MPQSDCEKVRLGGWLAHVIWLGLSCSSRARLCQFSSHSSRAEKLCGATLRIWIRREVRERRKALTREARIAHEQSQGVSPQSNLSSSRSFQRPFQTFCSKTARFHWPMPKIRLFCSLFRHPGLMFKWVPATVSRQTFINASPGYPWHELASFLGEGGRKWFF